MKRAVDPNANVIDPLITKRADVLTAGWCHYHRFGPKLPRRPFRCCQGCYGAWHERDGFVRQVDVGYTDNRTKNCLKCGHPATQFGGHVHRVRKVAR